MHQRTWLSLLTFPMVAAFTYPVMFRPAQEAPRRETKASSQDPLAGLSDIQDVLQLVRDNYVDPPDMEKVVGGGIQAALERAHPLNAWLSPEDLRLPDPGPADIGIRVQKRQIYAQVLAVTTGSPAAKAGFQPGDVIRKIDDDSIGPMSAWTLERRLRGAAGSQVSLLRYASANSELKKVTLTREVAQRPPAFVRKEAKASLVGFEDLAPGRTGELKTLLAGLDHGLPLVLDLRRCSGGDLAETALVAGLFAGPGPLVTIQETGKPAQTITIVPASLPPFAKLAVLVGPWTAGAPEALAAALKKQGVPVFGERTMAMGVERSRFLLRQGGAAEVVNRRWMGAGGEYLGLGGERPEALKPKPGADTLQPGVTPDHPLKNLKPEDDPLPKILETLAQGPKAAKLEGTRTTKRDNVLVSSLGSLDAADLA
ncbi:MAG TPA: S41 family peptidase [Holophaga sp.]|nr:S41 family peptidase [Holophaga sp.]